MESIFDIHLKASEYTENYLQQNESKLLPIIDLINKHFGTTQSKLYFKAAISAKILDILKHTFGISTYAQCNIIIVSKNTLEAYVS